MIEKTKVVVDSDLEPIMPGFLENRRKDLDLLGEAFQTNDLKTIETIGHKLAGNAGSYGLPDLGNIGREMEEAAIAGDIEKGRDCFGRYRDYMARLEISYEEID